MDEIDHGLEFAKGFDFVRLFRWLKHAKLFADKILSDETRNGSDKINAQEIIQLASDVEEARNIGRADHMAVLCIQISGRWAELDEKSFNEHQIKEALQKGPYASYGSKEEKERIHQAWKEEASRIRKESPGIKTSEVITRLQRTHPFISKVSEEPISEKTIRNVIRQK